MKIYAGDIPTNAKNIPVRPVAPKVALINGLGVLTWTHRSHLVIPKSAIVFSK